MPQAQRVVVVGGGVAALEAVLALRDLAGGRVDVEVVAPEPQFFYRPLSVAEPFALGEARRYDLGDLLEAAGASLTLGAVRAVDAPAHRAHLTTGAVVEFDALLVACGGVPQAVVDGAVTFRGPADVERVTALLAAIAAGTARSIAFVLPGGSVWALPLYELALLTGSWLASRGLSDVALTLVTPEAEPLELFGTDASAATVTLLEERGITIRRGSRAVTFDDGALELASGETLLVDRVIAMPRLVGPRIDGLPQTRHGFIPIDRHCRVEGLPGVYAAGDVTTFPVKQGGIATQQADVAAQAIAEAAGADVVPQPFRPVLRGMLLTGSAPQFMRHDLSHPTEEPIVSIDELWWPPAKIAGHYLGPFLQTLDGGVPEPVEPEPSGGVVVHVELDPDAGGPPTPDAAPVTPGSSGAVGELRLPSPLVVAPEDTLGEIAERMCHLDTGSAVVAEYGKTIGIITTRDLLMAFASRVHSSDARVRSWMTAHPLTIRGDRSQADAAALMREHDVHHLPVVDELGHAVGMLGLRDVDVSTGPRRSRPVR